MIEKTYIIIKVKDIINNMIEESYHTNDSFRRSLDGTEAILKFCCRHPNTMGGYIKYNDSEIKDYLDVNKSDWGDSADT